MQVTRGAPATHQRHGNGDARRLLTGEPVLIQGTQIPGPGRGSSAPLQFTGSEDSWDEGGGSECNLHSAADLSEAQEDPSYPLFI